MGYTKLFFQKLLFASILTTINTLFISICYTFNNHWYLVQLPLLLIFLFQMVSIFLILLLSLIKKDRRIQKCQINPLNICYFIPCYNQSQEEINNTMESFIGQTELEKHKKVYVTVCDGRKQGAGNDRSTDKILSEQVFTSSEKVIVKDGYKNDEGVVNQIEVLMGETSNQSPYFVLIKNKNQGKRDSIAIIRRLCYNFNLISTHQPSQHHHISSSLLSVFQTHLNKYNIDYLHHIVGVDADTIFQPDCTHQMLREIQRKKNILATTGMVKVNFTANTIFGKLMQGYQHVEYIAGQGFMRNQQNLTQQKINCLPGCLNITKVCYQTCGEELLGVYMKPPSREDHIFEWIRGTASEDRHSVMLLLKLYGNCHTTCVWDAQAITSVPVTPLVFLSQRKRWSLGSATHGFWLIFMENIPFFQRLSSLVFVLTYILTPFFLFSLSTWLSTIIRGYGDTLFWIMTALVQIVTLYKLTIVLWIKLSWKERLIYFVSYPVYYACGPVVGICVWGYSLYYMDDFGWGKTRTVIESGQVESENKREDVASSIEQFKSVSMSTTVQSLNKGDVEDINHQSINIRDEIVEEKEQESSEYENQRVERWRFFQKERVYSITLGSINNNQNIAEQQQQQKYHQQQQQQKYNSQQHNQQQQKEQYQQNSNMYIINEYKVEETLETQENRKRQETRDTNARESSIVAFSDSNITVTDAEDSEENQREEGQRTAAITERQREKAKIIYSDNQ